MNKKKTKNRFFGKINKIDKLSNQPGEEEKQQQQKKKSQDDI